MLRQNYNEPNRSNQRTTPAWKVVLLTAIVLALVALRLDFWRHGAVQPMLFGFLPVSLWWQVMISILAAVMMWLMVRLAWPVHLEELERGSTAPKAQTRLDSRRENN